ncbi:MAG: large conductance mechanosensitive channel protein MscL [Sphingomonadales bacterium]|nr:large conductance mechanosensitive channel protein MscL [Sphingomonadales bacterium]
MMSEFKQFIAKGNVMDLAVGVIIGGAFGKIVSALTDDIIMPLVGAVFGGLDFSGHYLVLGHADKVMPGMPLDAARKAGANVLAWGDLISVTLNFLILAFVIFQLVKFTNRINPPAPAAPAGPSEIDLLTEIRDSLKK